MCVYIYIHIYMCVYARVCVNLTNESQHRHLRYEVFARMAEREIAPEGCFPATPRVNPRYTDER